MSSFRRRSARIRELAAYAAIIAVVIGGVPLPALQSMIGPRTARAADFTWNGADGNFSSAASWGGTAPASDPTNVLIFGGAAGYTAVNDTATNFQLSQLVLTNTGRTFSIITGSSLFFPASSAAEITQNGTGGFLFTQPILFGAPLTVTGSGTGGVTFAGTLAQSGGTFGIVKGGPGRMTLLANNTFGGGITLAGGTIRIVNDNNLGAAGSGLHVTAAGTTFESGTATLGATRAFTLDETLTISPVANQTLTITGTISGAGGLVKGGYGGTLVLTNSANNYAGGTTVLGGVLTLTSGPVDQFTVGGTGDFTLRSGTLNLRNDGLTSNTTIFMGSSSSPSNLRVQGSAILSVDRVGANSGNAFVFNNLSMGDVTLTVASGNSDRVRIDGATSINGGSVFAPTGILELRGPIIGSPGAGITKASTGTLVIGGNQDNSATLSGPTNIFGGALQLTSTMGRPLGTGPVNVYGGGALRVTTSDSLGFQINVSSTIGGMGAVVMDQVFDPSFAPILAGGLGTPYGSGLRIGVGFTDPGLAISPDNFGANVYFGSQGNQTFSGILTPSDGVFRLANDAATSVLTMNGTSQFAYASRILFGNPNSNAAAVTGGSGTFNLTGSGALSSGLASIYRGSTINIMSQDFGNGGPLVTTGGRIEIYGTMTLSGTNGSLVDLFGNMPVFYTRPGGVIRLDNSAAIYGGFTSSGRVSDLDTVNLNGGTLQLIGYSGAITDALPKPVTETVGRIESSKGTTIALQRGFTNTAGGIINSVTLAAPTVARGPLGVGTLVVRTSTNGALGNFENLVITDSTGLYAGGLNGGTGSMAGAWIVDQVGNFNATTTVGNTGLNATFVTLSPTTGGAFTFVDAPFSANGINAASSNDIVDVSTTTALTGPRSVFALRISNAALTGSTVTIQGNSDIGSGLILQGVNNTHTSNFVFGNEALVYLGNVTTTTNAATVTTQTISGSITAANFNKFGLGTLVLSGTNSGMTGVWTVNSGLLQFANAQAINDRDIVMAGGSVTINPAVRTNSLIRVGTDTGTLSANGSSVSSIIFGYADFGDPEFLQLINSSTITVRDSVQLNALDNWWQANAVANVSGVVSGAGKLTKFGNNILFLDNPNNSFSGGLLVNSNGLVASRAASGTPFGTGNIIVNPLGGLRIAGTASFAPGQTVELRSDRQGLAAFAMSYNDTALPTNVSITRFADTPYEAFIGFDVAGVDNVNQATLTPLGMSFLMSTSNGILNGVIGAGAGNKFRFGGGSSGGANTLFVNGQLTGAANGLIIGALSNGDTSRQAASALLSAGVTTTVEINRANTYGGETWLNGNLSNQWVTLGNDRALSTGTVYLNGAGLASDESGIPILTAQRRIANTGVMIGDMAFGGSTGMTWAGDLLLQPTGESAVGAVRTISVNSTSAILEIAGAIRDGGGSGHSIVKLGAGTLELSGLNNTYSGITSVQQGNLLITSEANLSANSQLVLGAINLTTFGSLALWNQSITLNRNISTSGLAAGIDVAPGVRAVINGDIDGSALMNKNGAGTLVLNGENSNLQWQINAGRIRVDSPSRLGDIQTNANVLFNGGANAPRLQIVADGQSSITNSRGFQLTSINNNIGVLEIRDGLQVIQTGTGLVSSSTNSTFVITGGGEWKLSGNSVLMSNNTLRSVELAGGSTLAVDNTTANAAALTGNVSNTLRINGGTVRLDAIKSNAMSIASGTLVVNGGARIVLNSGATANDAQLTFSNLVRSNNGTLVITASNAAASLGATTSGADGRLIVTTPGSVLAVTNGMVAPFVVRQVSGSDTSGQFVTYVAGQGFQTHAGTTVSSANVVNPTAIAEITAPDVVTVPDAEVYAVEAGADISGGLLHIGSGGLIINGARTISNDLTFFSGQGDLGAPAAGPLPGEALIYVGGATDANNPAILSGDLFGTVLTKFGTGTLQLTSDEMSFGQAIVVNEGTLRFKSGRVNTRLANLVVNDGGFVDLRDGGVLSVGNVSSTGIAPNARIGSSLAGQGGVLRVLSTTNAVFAGQLSDDIALEKDGTGALTLSGGNSFTGGIKLYGGSIIGLDTQSLGGGAAMVGGPLTTPGVVTLYSGTLALNTVDGAQIKGTNVWGGATALEIAVRGNTTISVDRNGSGSFITQQIGDLSIGNHTLVVTGGNNYRFEAAGNITLLGPSARFNAASTAPSADIILSGLISGTGALNAASSGSRNGVTISGTANTYSGGTNVISQALQITATEGTPVGTGPLIVNPGAYLRIAGPNSLGGASLQILSSQTQLGALVLDADFDPTLIPGLNNAGVFDSRWSNALMFTGPVYTQNIDQSAIGNGRIFVGAYNTVDYLGTMTAGLLDGVGSPTPMSLTGVSGVYRLGASNGATFIFSGPTNALSGNNLVEFGVPRGTLAGVTNGSGVTIIRNSNNYTGGTYIGEGSTVQVETGGYAGSTPLGTGKIEVLGTVTLQGNAGSLAADGDTGFNKNVVNLRPGGTLFFDNSQVFGSQSTQGRWGDAAEVNLNGALLRMTGNSQVDVTETIGTINVTKMATVRIDRGSSIMATQLITPSIVRQSRGTLAFLSANNDSVLEQLSVAGGAGSITGGLTTGLNGGLSMLGPWLVYSQNNQFASLSGTNVVGAGFSLATANLGSATNLDIVDLTGSTTLAGDANVFALRVNGAFNVAGVGNTVHIAGSGGVAGLITTNNTGWSAGIETPGELIVYTAAGTMGMTGSITAAGLTKAGAGLLALRVDNPGLTGSVVVNQGTMQFDTAAALNGLPVTLNGGSLVLQNFRNQTQAGVVDGVNTVNTTFYQSGLVSIINDATISNNGQAIAQGITDLVINSRGPNVAPVVAALNGIRVRGTTTLEGSAILNITGTWSALEGAIQGPGTLSRFGSSFLSIDNTNGTLGGGAVFSQGGTYITTSGGTPLGTGAVTVNPGANLTFAYENSLANAVTVYSERNALGGFGVAYNTTTLPSNVTFVTTGPVDGVLNIDSRQFTSSLDLATLGPNGRLFLGTANSGVYAAATLGAGADNTYRLGAGGSTLNFSWYEGQLSGANAVQIGAYTTGAQASGITPTNSGSVALDNRNPLLTGDVTINAGATLTARVGEALGHGNLFFNGGTLSQGSQNLIVRNNAWFLGDMTFSGDQTYLGNWNLMPEDGAVGGATRLINVNNNMAMNGIISGADSSIIKGGTGTLILNGPNTFDGVVTVSAGTLIVDNDVLPGVAGPLGAGSSALMLGTVSSNTNTPTLQLPGRIQFGRSIVVVAGGTGTRFIRNQSVRRADILGNIAVAQAVEFESQFGGRLQLLGAINGVNQSVSFGTTTTVGPTGQIRLAAVVNGYNINDFTGTSFINDGRVIVAGKTLYTGPANNPTSIISGAFGGSTILFNGTSTSSAAVSGISAEGSDALIVNPIGFGNSTANINFRGLNSIEFTRDLNLVINSTTASARTFNVVIDSERGAAATFSGNISDDVGTGLGSIIKDGPGTLILTGNNTFRGGTVLKAGTVAVDDDGALGALTSTVTFSGGTLRFLGSTTINAARPLTLTSGAAGAGALQVDAGATVVFNGNFGLAGTGATPTLVKLGPGTLELNGTNQKLGTLVIGGINPSSGLVDGVGGGGGVVQTTALSGGVFVNPTDANAAVALNGGTLRIAAAGANVTLPRLLVGQSDTQFGSAELQLAAGATLSLTNATTAALGRNGQGTLVLRPTAMANLGLSENLVVSPAAAGSPLLATANGMLTLPFIIGRTNTDDANFLTLTATNSFAQNTAATAADLNSAGAAQMGDVTTVQALTGAVSVYALRTRADINGGSIAIGNGGLIINGPTASTVGSDLIFGTSPSALSEAFVYVDDNGATLAGSIRATDFTKFGGGRLVLSGSGSRLAAPAAGGRATLAINDGSLQFAGSAAVPTYDARPDQQVDVSIRGAAVLDLAGGNATIGGLLGTGRVVNSGAAAALTLNINNETSLFDGALSQTGGAISLVKIGSGTAVLDGISNYTGGTTIYAGRIDNAAAGLSTGALELREQLGLGSGPITLAGGTLALRNDAGNANIQELGFDITTFGPDGGYNITVTDAVVNGVAYQTSQISTDRVTAGSGAMLRIGDVDLQSNFLTISGSNSYRLQFNGTTNFHGDTTLNVANGATLDIDGVMTGPISALTKIGNGTLVLANGDNYSSVPFGTLFVRGGILETRDDSGVGNPLGTAKVVLSNGQWSLRNDGDGTQSLEINTILNTLVFGSDTGEKVVGVGTLNLDRLVSFGTGGSASNKHFVFDDVRIGGGLGAEQAIITGGNGFTFLAENTTLYSAVSLSAGIGATLANVSDQGRGYYIERISGNSLFAGNNTFSGGFFNRVGTTMFGVQEGSSSLDEGNIRLDNNATAGTGRVTIAPGARIRFNAASNVAAGQLVQVYSNVNGLGAVGIAGAVESPLSDVALANYDIRSYNSGVLSINGQYSQSIDMRTLGNGQWWLGSAGNGVQGSIVGGVFTGGLTAGADNTYRLGGDGASLWLRGVTLGDNARGAASVVVGSPLLYGNLGNAGLGNGTVIIDGPANYSGATVVNRNSTLRLRNGVQSPSITNFGTVVLEGENGTLVGGSTTLDLKPGSLLQLNNDSGGRIAGDQGRLADDAVLNLNSSTLQLVGTVPVDTVERIGGISFTGGSELVMQTVQTGRVAQLVLTGANPLVRNGQATLLITSSNGGRLGSEERLVLAGSTLTPVNGMVAPWMINRVDGRFVSYVDPSAGGTGFASAEFDATISTTSGGLTGNLSRGTQKLLLTGTPGSTLTFAGANDQLSAYAVRLDVNLAPAGANNKLVIGSGGIISMTNATVTTTLAMNDGVKNLEAIIFNQANFVLGTTANSTDGQLITNGLLTKAGVGNLIMQSQQAVSITSAQVNQGGLALRSGSALGPTTARLTLAGISTTAFFQNDAATTFNVDLDLARDVAFATATADRLNTTAPAPVHTINSLTFEGSAGAQGQSLNVVTNSSGGTLRVTQTTRLSDGVNVINTNGANVFLDGKLTGGGAGTLGAALTKTGTSTLVLSNASVANANDFTGGVAVWAGVLEAREVTDVNTMALQANVLGNNDITLYGGQLNLRATGTNGGTVQTVNLNNRLTVVGNAIIDVNRLTGSGTNKTIELPSLTIGNAILTTTGGNNYTLRFDSLNLRGTALLSVGTATTALFGQVGGAGFGIIKDNTGNLNIATSNLGITEGIVINRGGLDFTGSLVLSNTIGKVRINPGAQILLRRNAVDAEFNAGQLQAYTSGAGYSMVRLVGTLQNPENILTKDSETILAVNANLTPTTTFNLDAIGNGQSYLGATGGNIYGAVALGASTANVLAGKGSVATNGFDRVYRLGGGGSTLTLNSPTLESQLADNSAIVIGSMLGSGGGSVIFNDLMRESSTSPITVVRGSGLFVTTGAAMVNGAAATPLGGGTIDVYGTIEARTGATFVNTAGTAHANQLKLHPGAVLSFNNNVTTVLADRWLDTQGVALDGSEVQITGASNAFNNETVGALTFGRNSTVRLLPTSSGTAQLTVQSLSRVGPGSTLTFSLTNGTAMNLGDQGRLVINDTSNLQVVNGMLAGYMVNGSSTVSNHSATFVTLSGTNSVIAAGFTQTVSGGTFTGMSDTDIVNVTTTAAVAADARLYALRLTNTSSLLGSAEVGFTPRITFASSGPDAVGGLITTTNVVINNVDLQFGNAGTGDAYIYTSNGTLTYTGEIKAGSITKFGAGAMTIAKDQTQLVGANWFVNAGTLTLNTLNAAGAGSKIYLQAGNQFGGSVLSLAAGSTSSGAFTSGDLAYSFDRIVSVDNNTLSWDPLADDRQQRINAIDLVTTGAADSRLLINAAVGRNRDILNVGTLTVVDPGAAYEQSAVLDIRAPGTIGAFNQSGRRNGIAVDSLVGAGQALTKWGNGYLYLNNDNSATWTGGQINIDLGAVNVRNSRALGDAASTVNVRRYGVLDVAASDFFTGNQATINYADESVLRLSTDVNNFGTLDVAGATLQIAADQHAAGTVVLHGGGIEGFLLQDEFIQAVNRTTGANFNLVLAENGFIGQNRTASDSGLDSGQNYVNNSGANATSPLGYSFFGATLEVKGSIGEMGGPRGLTKRGFDMVILSGANTYSGGTTVLEGILAIGRNNALSTAGALVTRGGNAFNNDVNGYVTGVFDLNGFNQQVSELRSGQTLDDGGYVYNSAVNVSTFTVNQNSDTVYNGGLVGNIALVKGGTGALTFAGNENTFTGGATVNGGILRVNGNGFAASGVTVNGGGTLAGTGSVYGATINAGGTHNPGELAVTTESFLGQNYVLSGGTLVIDVMGLISGTTLSPSLLGNGTGGIAGVNNDYLNNINTMTLGSGAVVQLVGLSTTGLAGAVAGWSGNRNYSFLLGSVSNTINLGTYSIDTSIFGASNSLGGDGTFTLTVGGNNLYLVFDRGLANNELVWKGTASNVWDTSTVNWAGDATVYTDGSLVTFDDTLSVTTNTNIQIAAPVAPGGITVTNSAINYSFNGAAITGAGGLVKNGTGTLTINNDNTFTGPVQVQGGTLAIGSGGTTGSVTADIVDNGLLQFNRSNNLTYGGAISGTGTLQKFGTGTLILSGASTYSGTTTITGGSIQIGNGGTTGSIASGRVVTAASTSLIFNRTDTVTYGGVVSGAGGLRQDGTGRLILAGANSYTGVTTVSAGATLQVGDGGTNGQIVGNVTDTGLLVFARSDAAGYGGVISGAGDVEIVSGSAFTLTGANTYTGVTTIRQGMLSIGSGGTTGSVNSASIVDNGVLQFNRSTAVGYGGVISGTGMLVKQGSSSLTLTGENTYTGVTSIAAGTLQIGAGGTVGSIASLSVVNTGTLAFSRSDTLTYAGSISSVGSLQKLSGGTLILTGENTYIGITSVLGGVLQIGDNGTTGSIAGASNITVTGTTAGSLLRFFRSNDITYGGIVSGTGALEKLGAGTLFLTNANTYSGGTTISAGILSIGNGGASGSIAGNVLDNGVLAINRSDAVTFTNVVSGSGAFVQQGSGTTILSAANTYSGPTTVAGGILQLNGSLANSRVYVENGGTFTGTGAVAGVTVDNGGIHNPGVLAPGTQNMSAADYVLNAGGTLVVDLLGTVTPQTGPGTSGAAGTNNDFLSNIANLTINNGAVLEIVGLSGLGTNGAVSGWNAASSYSFLIGSFAGAATLGAVTFDTSLFTNFNSLGSNVFSLAVNGGNLYLNYAAAAASQNLVWSGATNNIWNTADQNWNPAGTVFVNGDQVTFNDVGANTSIQIQSSVAPSSITVDNSTATYMFSGAAISGTTGLLKTGSGLLILANDNTYTGATTINGGILQLGNAGTTGSITSTTVADNGVLRINRSDAVTFAAAISGTGAFDQAGTGTTVLSGANTYSGGTTVSGGILQYSADNNLGNATGTVWLSGGYLQPTADATLSRSVVLSSANGGFNVGAGLTLTDSGVISGTGSLSIVGGGTIRFANSSTNTFSGVTTVNGSTLVLASTVMNGAILGNGISNTASPDIVVTNGGKLYWQNGDQVGDTVDILISGAGSSGALTGTFFTGATRNEVLGSVTVQNGGVWTTGRGWTVSYADPTVTGPGSIQNVSAVESGDFNISDGGTARIWGDGGSGFGGASFRITSTQGGLNFSGTGGFMRIASDSSFLNAGRLILDNNVTYNGNTNAARIYNVVAGDITGSDTAVFGTSAGVVDFDGGVRTFTIADGVATGTHGADMIVTAQLTNGGLVKQGAGELVITNHAITGGISVSGGILTMGGSIGKDGSTFALHSGGGFSAGAVVIDGSGTGAVTEGYSGIGTATFANTGAGSSIWEGGSSLVFQFKGVTTDSAVQTAAGTDWDLINNNVGALLVTATAGNQIKIVLESLSTLTSLGAASGFTSTSANDYLWKFATNVPTIDPTAFTFDQRGVWTNSTFAGGYGSIDRVGGGSFYVTQISNDLYIGYSSVPEPGSMLLAGLAALGMGGYGWRRRKKNRTDGDADPVAAQATGVEDVVAVAPGEAEMR